MKNYILVYFIFKCIFLKMVEKILEITPEKIRGYDKLSEIDKQRVTQLAALGGNKNNYSCIFLLIFEKLTYFLYFYLIFFFFYFSE